MSFFSFLDPMFRYIDGGKLFRQPFMWLYYILGVITALACFGGVGKVCELFRYLEGIQILWGVIAILILLAAAVFSVLYWFRRASDVNADVPQGARFLAIPAVANLVRCFGEWISIVFGVCGTLITLFAWIFAANQFDLGGEGIFVVIAIPVFAYINLIFTRFLSESMLAIASIANDVHELATFNPPVDQYTNQY